MPVDIPQLKEDLEFHSYMKYSTSSRSIYWAARAVVEAPTIQWCEVHDSPTLRGWIWHDDEIADWDFSESPMCETFKGDINTPCVVKPMLLVDPT